MENTKDLVRAERGSRFVCQASGGGTPAAPRPQEPLQLFDPAPRPVSPSHAPSTSGAPLPLPAVKRFGGFPSPHLLSPGFVGVLSPLSRHFSGRKHWGESFLCAPSPPPSALAGGGGEARFVTFLTFFSRPGWERGALRSPGGHGRGAVLGKEPLSASGQCREAFCTWRWILKGGGVGTCGRERWEWCLGSGRPGRFGLKGF